MGMRSELLLARGRRPSFPREITDSREGDSFMTIKVTKNQNPGMVETRVKAMADGLKKMPSSEFLDVRGAQSAPDSLATEFVTRGNRYDDADTAIHAAKLAVEARDQAQPETVRRLDAVEEALRSHFGPSNPRLSDFGIKPRKAPRTLTPEQQQEKVAKLRASRAARKKAKAAVPPPTAGGDAKA
jgi:hypothetical protein